MTVFDRNLCERQRALAPGTAPQPTTFKRLAAGNGTGGSARRLSQRLAVTDAAAQRRELQRGAAPLAVTRRRRRRQAAGSSAAGAARCGGSRDAWRSPAERVCSKHRHGREHDANSNERGVPVRARVCVMRGVDRYIFIPMWGGLLVSSIGNSFYILQCRQH